MRNKLLFDAMSLPLRKNQRAIVPHRNDCMAKRLNNYSAITSEEASQLDEVLLTPVCHIRFLFQREREPNPAKSFGHKKRRNSDAVPPRRIYSLLFLQLSGCSAATLFGPIEPFPSVAHISLTLPPQTRLRVRRRNFVPCYLRRAKRRAANAAADAAIAAPAAPKPRAAEVSFVFANFAGLSAFFWSVLCWSAG